jgi:integrase
MPENNLQQLFELYIKECMYSMCLRPETIRGYSAVFTLFLKVMPEVADVTDLKRSMLIEFFHRIQTRERVVGKNQVRIGVRKSTTKTHWTKLNVFFKWLKEKQHIKQNPLEGIKPPRVSYIDFKRLTPKEINRIYASISLSYGNSLAYYRNTMMVSLLLFCGLRRGELIGLQVKDIDLGNKNIQIRGETSKSGQTRILRIHPTLVLHVKNYFQVRKAQRIKSEKLIISTLQDQGLTMEGLRHWVKSIQKKSGVKFHLHQFRHTFASMLAEQNVNLFKIQKMMGHSSITMTEKYVRSLKPEDMMEDIERLSID